MTGARPDRIGVIENTAYFRELNPEIVTLPQHFIKMDTRRFIAERFIMAA